MERFRAKVALALAAAFATGLIAAVASFGQGPSIPLPPDIRMTLSAEPAPIPVPSEGRIPVSLRLATSISTDAGSHPAPATRILFEFDRQFQLTLAGLPNCSQAAFGPRTARSPCEEVRFASGRSIWEVAFPGQEPTQVEGRTIAYKIGPRRMAFRVFLPAPVTAEVLIPVAVKKAPTGSVYGLGATAVIPKVAGGYGSLLRLGLRFRKGVFSLACPKRRFQASATATLVDGTRLSMATVTTC